MKCTFLLTAALLTVPALAQEGPFGGPPRDEQAQAEAAFKVLEPAVDKAAGTVSIPAAFWNQHMTDWVEVGVCGRPSDFLHETIVAISTTKAKMIAGLRRVGCRDADFWVDNVVDFPRVRGDRVLVLMEVTFQGKKEIFPLDELLAYRNWGVSVGPFGWMFKGEPDREERQQPAASRPALSPRQQILRDDPQVAVQFKGIQNASQSYIDHPLCYDTWIYPVVRYQRNYAVRPRNFTVPATSTDGKEDAPAVSLAKFWAKIYDSNGEVPVTMTVKKVTEVEFIETMAKHWHEARFADYILAQLPSAKRLDTDKAELEKLIPELRRQAATGKPREDIQESELFAKIALLTARVEKEYAALDAAWVSWSAKHVVFQAPHDAALTALREQARLWEEHMVDWKQRAAYYAAAEDARYRLRAAKAAGDPAAIRQLRGAELEARSRGLLLENKHPLVYWLYEFGRLTPDETRVDWVRNIKAQLALARAKEALGKTGIELATRMQERDADVKPLQAQYERAVAQMTLCDLQVELSDVLFEISKRESIQDDTDLPGFIKRREALQKQIKTLAAATQPK